MSHAINIMLVSELSNFRPTIPTSPSLESCNGRRSYRSTNSAYQSTVSRMPLLNEDSEEETPTWLESDVFSVDESSEDEKPTLLQSHVLLTVEEYLEGEKATWLQTDVPLTEEHSEEGTSNWKQTKEEFTYCPLPEVGGQIRLITLLPYSQSAGVELHCTVYHVSLSDKPKYAALSYAWGSPERTKFISVDGRRIHITENLEMCLLHLRHEREGLVLWIDSICINQMDNIEKGKQVEQMGEIYSQAAVVIAWLGPQSADSDLAIEKLRGLGKRSKKFMPQPSAPYQDRVETSFGGMATFLNMLTAGSSDDHSIPVPAITNLLRRDYWNRVWIQQELMLAKDIIFVCGWSDIDEKHLAPALQACLSFATVDSPHRKTSTDSASHWDLLAMTYVIPESLLKDRKPEDRTPLFDLLFNSKRGRGQRLRASNPRDYIYGFLSLATKDSADSIMPDYAKRCTDLYIEVTKAALMSGKIDILRYAGYRSKGKMRGLPSWTVDWSERPHHAADSVSSKLTSGPMTSFFSASGKESSVCKFTDASELKISGICVDTIRRLGPDWEMHDEVDERARLDFITFVDKLRGKWKECENRDQDYLSQALWRVPIADIEISPLSTKAGPVIGRATHRSKEGFEHLIKAKLVNRWTQEDGDCAYWYLRSMNELCHGRRTFVTEDGLIGIAGTEEVKVGDPVCVLTGASMPLVLRKNTDDQYVLVCDAYVQGIMDGEVLKQGFVVREFAIV